MRPLLSAIGIAAALVMAGVSASMNYVFLAALGKTSIEGQMLGAASAAADLLKCLLPFFIAWAWRERRFVAAMSGVGVFILFAGFSLLSAIGFAAVNRSAVVESRAAGAEAYELIQRDYDRKQSELTALPPRRPATVVAEELRAVEQSRLWARSSNCSEATESASREFCTDYYRLRAEQAAAEEAPRLESALASLQEQLKQLKSQGAGQESDAQVATLSDVLALPEDRVRLALIVLVALVVELGSSLGLYLAMGPSNNPSRTSIGTDDDQAGVSNKRPAGDIEDFVLEELMPMPGAGLSLADLQAAYVQWCERRQFNGLNETAFGDQFRELAVAVRLSQMDGQYRGIALKARIAAAA